MQIFCNTKNPQEFYVKFFRNDASAQFRILSEFEELIAQNSSLNDLATKEGAISSIAKSFQS